MDEKVVRLTPEDLKQEMEKPMLRLCHLLSPPDVRANRRILNDGEIEYSLRWVGLLGSDDKGVNQQEARLCLLQLGLMVGSGKIDEARTTIIADYIWERYPDPPDYVELVHWLKTHHPVTLPPQHADRSAFATDKPDTANAKKPTATKKQIRKKRKQQRQAKKSSRRK